MYFNIVDLPPPGHRRGKRRVVVKSKTAAKMANFKTVCSYFKDQVSNSIGLLGLFLDLQ